MGTQFLKIRRFKGIVPYEESYREMVTFTQGRTELQADEIWLLEHAPVFTQGQAGKAEHILNPHDVPVVQSDRGGQVTYHGPGQIMIYTLLNLKRRGLSIKSLVCFLEKSIQQFLKNHQIEAHIQAGAPGLYTSKGKICSLGLRVKKGSCYHGLCLNVAMDLTPFSWINPCGFANQPMTDMRTFNPAFTTTNIMQDLEKFLADTF